MLQRLSIENYVLIDSLELNLSNSLNIITGETGAGKSILLGALGLLCGNRADVGVIKDKSRNCIIEGSFNISEYGLSEFFDRSDLDYDDVTVVRRVINPTGKSRAYINDLPVSLAILKEFVSQLIDIHSQHQTLQMADEKFRISICDKIADSGDLLSKYRDVYSHLRGTQQELKRLEEEIVTSKRDKEWLEYQVEELDAANLIEGEFEALEVEFKGLTNADSIKSALSSSLDIFRADEGGVLTLLNSAYLILDKIGDVFPFAKEASGRIRSSYIELSDVEGELNDRLEDIDSSPQRLGQVESRLNTLYTLQQKHKVRNQQELMAAYEEYAERLSNIDGVDDRLDELQKQIGKLDLQARELAGKLTKKRTKSAKIIGAYVEETLGELGMANSQFIVVVEPSDKLRSSGMDVVTILFSANRNMEAKAIEKVASGGELSRVMLSVKSLVAKSSKLPTIIFDEIDTGVSGQTADKIGDIIVSLSNSMQVINITHLPQVASKGDTHWYVYKDESGDVTKSCIELLDGSQRVEQIARMLSGSEITPAAREQALFLLKKSE